MWDRPLHTLGRHISSPFSGFSLSKFSVSRTNTRNSCVLMISRQETNKQKWGKGLDTCENTALWSLMVASWLQLSLQASTVCIANEIQHALSQRRTSNLFTWLSETNSPWTQSSGLTPAMRPSGCSESWGRFLNSITQIYHPENARETLSHRGSKYPLQKDISNHKKEKRCVSMSQEQGTIEHVLPGTRELEFPGPTQCNTDMGLEHNTECLIPKLRSAKFTQTRWDLSSGQVERFPRSKLCFAPLKSLWCTYMYTQRRGVLIKQASKHGLWCNSFGTTWKGRQIQVMWSCWWSVT